MISLNTIPQIVFARSVGRAEGGSQKDMSSFPVVSSVNFACFLASLHADEESKLE